MFPKCVAIVGKGEPFKIFTDSENQTYLNMVKDLEPPLLGEQDALSENGMSEDDLMGQGPSGSGIPGNSASDVDTNASTGGHEAR